MAALRDDERGRFDYRLMQNSPIALYYSAAILWEHVRELESLGY
jgi:hypothetical protein